MTVQRDNLEAVSGAEVVEAAESVLEGTPVAEPETTPAPPTEVPDAPPVKKDDPEVKPMCCGMPPGPMMLVGTADSGGDVEHQPDCPNHPDNLATAEKVS
jgi:hypothetical protein